MTDLQEALAKLRKGQEPTPPPGYLTVKQVAAGANVHVDVVKKWRQAGRFPNAIRLKDTRTSPWFIPESDILAAADVEAIDPTAWVVHLGCKGLVCGACSTVLVPKPKDKPLVTATQLLGRAVADHLPTCHRAQET